MTTCRTAPPARTWWMPGATAEPSARAGAVPAARPPRSTRLNTARPRTTRLRAGLAAALGSVVLLAGCGTTQVVNPVSGQTERTVMDERAEAEQGLQAHRQILAETPAYPDARLQQYVSALGARLAAQSHRPQLAWTFTVLDSPEVNAFALPGGYVYVTRGILAYLDSEADLAGVIGHEIGHVTARHGAQRATRQQTAGVGVLAAAVAGVLLESVGVSGAAQAATQLSQGVAAGWVARHSREQELQADQLGAEYLVRNRFDPHNMVDVIQVLKNQERFAADQAKAAGRAAPEGGGYLATHPSNDQRLADIRRIADGLGAQRPAQGFADEGRTRYLQAIDGITFGDGRAQGVVRGRQFFHEPLGIALTAPEGWQVVNGAQTLALVNPAGDAALVVAAVPDAVTGTPEAVIRQTLKAAEVRLQPRQQHGLAVNGFVAVQRDARGNAASIRGSLAPTPGGARLLLRWAGRDTAALQRAQAGLAEAESSLRPLGAAERAAARPWAVRRAALPRGGWAELARQSALGPGGEGLLRLINGAYGGGAEVAAGQPVKQVLAQP